MFAVCVCDYFLYQIYDLFRGRWLNLYFFLVNFNLQRFLPIELF